MDLHSHTYCLSAAFENINLFDLAIFSLILFPYPVTTINITISVLFLCSSGRNLWSCGSIFAWLYILQ